MLSTKPVLPNLLKTLVIASIAVGSGSAFAEHHGEAKKEIGDLKDMSTDVNERIKAVDMTEKADSSAIKEVMSDKAKNLLNAEQANDKLNKAKGLKPN